MVIVGTHFKANPVLGARFVVEYYNHKEVEARWAERWFSSDLYRAVDFSEKPKRYILVEFPYPSGSGLHCGHVYRFTSPDVYARKLRMSGYNVLLPIGWDAFGLPAENYAVKTGVHPAVTTKSAIDTFRRQMRQLGYGFDWKRELSTTHPDYYKWTQWLFLKFFEAGLAELREQPVWWCEALKTVLANEEVLDDGNGGKISERGDHPVEKRMLKQWILKMPEYAEKLLAGLDEIDFPESVKTAQREWIGRSVGATVRFPITGRSSERLEVFTTRPDTIFGVTFMVLAPEHPLVDASKASIKNWAEVEAYRVAGRNRSDRERKADKEKTGVRLQGFTVDHPVLGASHPLPVFIADYVLMEYGTGAIMAVPGHDERDFEFAKKYDLPIVATVVPADGTEPTLPYTGAGIMRQTPEMMKVFSGGPLGKPGASVGTEEMKELVVSLLASNGLAEKRVTYKIRDWLFSRQRYWGEPMPLLHREDGTIVPLCATTDAAAVQKNLPLVLPEVPDYLPSSDGESPLSKNKSWVNTNDSSGQPVRRETNTMPNWAGSCWYFLRYIDPRNTEAFADPKLLQYWLPVDRYFGGSEHTTLHLLYSRFWHRFFYDLGLVPTKEPYQWRLNGGILLGPDNQKMSKSLGNVINPDDKIEAYGGDALRLYICFMGPYDATLPWSENGLKACRKLVERIWELSERVVDAPATPELEKAYHKCVKRISSMFDNLKTNTAVSELMIFVREAEGQAKISRTVWEGFLKVLAPLAPFVSEELWHKLHGWNEWKPERSIHVSDWPTYDEALATDTEITVGVQVNGKVRDEVLLAVDEAESSVKEKALALPGVQKWMEGKTVRKFIYVPGRIVNIVVG